MTIVSGPAKAEPLWQLVRTVLFLGFAGWFVLDGAVLWPNKVVSEAKKELQKPDPWQGKVTYESLPPAPSNVEFERLKVSGATTADQVAQHLGQPTFERPDGRTRALRYYVSKWGYAVVSFDSGRPELAGAAWKDWFKTPSDIQGQFYWALIPALPGLYFLWLLIKAVTLKVVLDDEGLNYAGKRIPYDAITGLRGYSPKGLIDLFYNEGGVEKKIRFDNEKFALFDEIVAAISERKGFINEIEAYKADQARRHADEEAARAAEDQAGGDSGKG